MALARKKINRNYKELEIQEEKEYADYTLINIFINGFLLFLGFNIEVHNLNG
jgi:hypothetical protein